MAADADTTGGEVSTTTPALALSPPGGDETEASRPPMPPPGAAEPDSGGREGDSEPAAAAPTPSKRPTLWAVVLVIAVVLSVAGLAGWLGRQAREQHLADQRSQMFLDAARQTALNITTLDWQHADTDVQRILDASTGTFHDDLVKRRDPFTAMIKAAQSTSAGSITDVGVESESDNEAQVVVVASIKTSNMGTADPSPRIWRLRIGVQRVGDGAKASTVQFVP